MGVRDAIRRRSLEFQLSSLLTLLSPATNFLNLRKLARAAVSPSSFWSLIISSPFFLILVQVVWKFFLLPHFVCSIFLIPVNSCSHSPHLNDVFFFCGVLPFWLSMPISAPC